MPMNGHEYSLVETRRPVTIPLSKARLTKWARETFSIIKTLI